MQKQKFLKNKTGITIYKREDPEVSHEMENTAPRCCVFRDYYAIKMYTLGLLNNAVSECGCRKPCNEASVAAFLGACRTAASALGPRPTPAGLCRPSTAAAELIRDGRTDATGRAMT